MRRLQSLCLIVLSITLLTFPALSKQVVLKAGILDNLLFKEEHLAQAVDDFTKAYPNVRVELSTQSADSTIVQIAAGVGPDVLGQTATQALGLFASGAIRDLKELTGKDPDFSTSAFLPGMLGAFDNGQARWGIPFSVLAWVTTYNADYFDMAGLPLPAVGPGWTWETIKEMGRKLTIVDSAGVTTRYGLMLGYNQAPSWPAWVPLTYQAGGGLSDRAMNPTKIDMRAGSVRQALDFMFSLWDEGMMASVGGVTVRNGKAAMNMTFTPRTVDYWQSYLGPQARVGQIQQPRGPVKDGWFVDAQGFCIATATANPEVAWDFVKFLTLRPRSSYSLMKDAGRMSALTENTRYFSQQVDMASRGEVLYAIGNLNNVTRPVFQPGLLEMIDKELAKVQTKKAALDPVLDDIQRMADAMLAEYHSKSK